jgi:hypothetical protein
MTSRRVTISPRPQPASPAEAWVREGNSLSPSDPASKADIYTARLTIDITPELRGRIKVQAFQKGMTVAELLRGLLDREFTDDNGADHR